MKDTNENGEIHTQHQTFLKAQCGVLSHTFLLVDPDNSLEAEYCSLFYGLGN